jgi:O-antigen/teichoic acid export membrane protein
MVVAVFAIPLLVKGLGTERFGLLTLIWAIVGYFSIFDLGLGRALTKLVAEKLASEQSNEIPSLFWTSVSLMFLLGLVSAAVLAISTPWLVRDVLGISKKLQPEALLCCYLLAISMPIVISTMGLSGFLEAHQRFPVINAIRVPMGIFTFISPLVMLYFYKGLVPVVAILVFGRLVAWLAYAMSCLTMVPQLRRRIIINYRLVSFLFKFGGWITVSNTISPVLLYLDRFLIAALVSTVAVAYYATPYDLMMRTLIISTAFVGVLFPAFTTSFTQDRERALKLFMRAIKYIFLLMFPLTFFVIIFAREGLNLWLGAEFATHSTRVLQYLAVGIFANSLAQVPVSLIQGMGRPDLTAKLHLIELPLYVGFVVLMIRSFGVEGAAIAWMLRVTIDMLFLFTVLRVVLRQDALRLGRAALVFTTAGLLLVLAFAQLGAALKAMFLMIVFITFVLTAWFRLLAPEERSLIQGWLRLPSYSQGPEAK